MNAIQNIWHFLKGVWLFAIFLIMLLGVISLGLGIKSLEFYIIYKIVASAVHSGA